MAVKFVFEDGENTPSSFLLKQSHHGKHIYFSNGVSQLLSKALEIKEPSDIVCMFYDVSPNNRKTVKGYELLVETLRQNADSMKDMFVIPIICIEYHICKVLYLNNWLYAIDPAEMALVQNLVAEFNYDDLPVDMKGDDYVATSLEHAYKNILSRLKMRCLHNSFEYSGDSKVRKVPSIRGQFYEKDCVCDRKYCKIDCNETLKAKAEKLYCSLPVFAVDDDFHRNLLVSLGIHPVVLSAEDIILERKIFYDKICHNMKLPLISINI